jgi:hypothetical protein
MAVPQKNNLLEGINLDLDELRIPPNFAIFIKNLTDNVNINANAATQAGQDKIKTPIEGNTAITLAQTIPSGINYCIGAYSSEQTNECYFFLYNSNGQHSAWVISGDLGVARMFHMSSLLNFQLKPQYFISEGRCTLELVSFYDKTNNSQSYRKLLCFTDNFNEPRCIDVESSYQTNSFTTPYFTASLPNYYPETLITLGVPLPIKCMGLNTPVAYNPVPADTLIQNLEIRRAWQFRVKFIDVFGRESEHGIISNQYITVIGGGCITASNGQPRCVVLNFDAGNPFVDFIQIEFRLWVDGLTPMEGQWQISDTIAKWDNSANVQYYNRNINPALVYNASTNTIAYTFCADKESLPIDPAETSRTEPLVPRLSSSCFSMAKRLGLANNLRNFEPISPSVLSGINVTAKDPNASDVPCPSNSMVNITFYLVCFRPYYNTLTWCLRQTFGQWGFGEADGGDCATGRTLGSTSYTSTLKLDETFGDQTNPGFIAYAAGTNYKCIMKPGHLDPVTGAFTPTPMPAYSKCMQGTLRVPAGKYVIRIASHKATINDSDLQSTSTYVCGQTFVQYLANPIYIRNDFPGYVAKEIVIDCTGGVDVNLNSPTSPVFVVMALDDGVHSGAQDGYLYEYPGGKPIEMAPCFPAGLSEGGAPMDGYGSFWTDHNGFYFCTSPRHAAIKIKLDMCDGAGPQIIRPDILTPLTMTNTAAITHGDGSGTPPGACWGVGGNWKNKVYVFPGATSFPAGAQRKITLHAGTCNDINVGVPGVLGVPRLAQPAITDVSGNAVYTLHNVYEYSAVWSPLPVLGSLVPTKTNIINTQQYLILSQTGACQWNTCTQCGVGMGDPGYGYDECGTTRTRLLQIQAKSAGTNLYGIQSGGRYSVSIIAHDILGRHTFAQKVGYVSSANLNDTTYQKFALQKIGYSIAPGTTFPTIFKYITFAVGVNTIFSDFFSWAVDWVQPVDNGGNTSGTPTSIRIYYTSLNEYNKQFNFNTTTNWEFIGTNDQGGTTGVPVEGDIIQFIMNGNGSWFNSVKQGIVRYSQQGTFVLIDYDSGLIDNLGQFLMNGALFRVIRPVQFQENDVNYYEQCFTIQLNPDGTVPSSLLNGVLPYFDSYLVQRQIPVPQLANQPAAIPPGGAPPNAVVYTSTGNPTSPVGNYIINNPNFNNLLALSTTDNQTTFPFYFETPSASDWWGNHVSNRGRIFVVNPYEEERRIGTEIALSDTLSDRGTLNGLSYFESQNAQVFDRNTFGDITLVFVEMGELLVICTSDYFVTRYNQTQIQITETGQLVGQNSQGEIFTSPQVKVGSNFGLIPTFINTATKFNGQVAWLDAKGHLIFSDFNQSKMMEKDNYQGYILNKIAAVNIDNQNPNNGLNFFVGGIDPKSMEYYLTRFNISIFGTAFYFNLEAQPKPDANETMVFDMATGRLKLFVSPTPEMWARLPGYYSQRQFISFKGGAPYAHHGNPAAGALPPFANFYGRQCECRVTVVANEQPEKPKRFLYCEVFLRQTSPAVTGVMPQVLFFSDLIYSEKGQFSRLFPLRWSIRDGFNCAEFLCDMTTPADPNLPSQTGPNSLLDGNPMQGRWLKQSLVTQQSYDGRYFELSAVNIYMNGIYKADSGGQSQQ